VEKKNLHWMTQHPRTLLYLANRWPGHKNIGSMSTLLHDFCLNLANEGNPALNVLSVDETIQGVKRIAAVTLLGGVNFIKLQNGSKEEPSIDQILSDWNHERRSAILKSGFFRAPLFEKIEFINSEIVEYLSAMWLLERLNEKSITDDIQQILFRTIGNKSILLDRLKPIVAWIAPFNKEIFNLLLENSPETILLQGDHQEYHFQNGRKAIQEVFNKYESRSFIGWETTRHRFKLLARAEYSDLFHKILSQKSKAAEIKRLILRTILEGKLEGFLNDSLKIASNKNEDGWNRRIAVEICKESQSHDILSSLKKWLLNQNSFKDINFVCQVCDALYPSYISIDELIAVLRKSPKPVWNRGGKATYYLEREFAYSIPINELLGTFNFIYKKVVNKKAESKYQPPTINSNLSWAVSALGFIYCRILEKYSELSPQPSVADITKLYDIIVGLSPYNGSYRFPHEEIQTAHKKFQKRNELITRCIKRGDHLIEFGRHNLLVLTSKDSNWIIAKLKKTKSEKVATQFFHNIRHIIDPDNNEKVEDKISNALTRFPNLKKGDLESLKPKKFDWQIEQEKRQRQEDKERKKTHQENKKRILDNLELIKKGKPKSFKYLHHFYSIMSKRSDKREEYNFDILADRYNKKIANVAKTGLINWWKNNKISEETRSATYGDIVSLCGFSVALNQGFNLKKASNKDTLKILNLGLKEINGYPDWFFEAALEKPKLFVNWLEPILAEDFKAMNTDYNSFLSNDWNFSIQIKELISPILISFIKENSPASRYIAEKATEILIDCQSSYSDEIRDIASKYSKDMYRKSNQDLFLPWFRFWMFLDSDEAWSWFYKNVYKKKSVKKDYLVTCFAYLSGDRRASNSMITLVSKLSTDIIAAMYSAIYLINHPKDDPWHEHVYSPKAEDIVPEFRDALFQELVNRATPEAISVLKRLSEKEELLEARDSILRALERSLNALASKEMVNVSQILECESLGSLLLFESQEQYNRMIEGRIRFALNDLCNSDFSLAELIKEERHLQLIMADKLQAINRSQYQVVREKEVKNKKEPDISLGQGDKQFALELKYSRENQDWTYTELHKALKTQLVGQYLRAGCKSGMLLVVSSIKKKYKVNNQMVTFDEMIQLFVKLKT